MSDNFTSSTLRRQADYPDWLNPVLVKELRQGLRQGAFVAAFVAAQAILLVMVGCNLIGETNAAEVGEALNTGLWAVIGFFLLIIVPARAMAAIHDEKKMNTLELLQLSRQGSFRIVLGKWLAVVSQSLLLFTSALPYLVLQYFFGGLDVPQNVRLVVLMLLASLTFSATFIWLSTLGALARLVAVALLWLSFMYFLTFALLAPRLATMRGSGPSSPGDDLHLLPLVFGAAVSIPFMLVLAASRIASAAENHSVALRGIALATCLAGVAGALAGEGPWLAVMMPVQVTAMILSLAEPTSNVPAHYAPWLAWGAVGRFAGRLFNPGWVGGIVFSLIVFLLLCVPHVVTQALGLPAAYWKCFAIRDVAMFFALISPLPVLALLPRMKHRFWLYALLWSPGVLVSYIARGMAFQDDQEAAAVLDALTPVSAAIWSLGHLQQLEAPQWRMFEMITLPLGALMLLFLAWRSRREFRLMREMERQAASLPASP